MLLSLSNRPTLSPVYPPTLSSVDQALPHPVVHTQPDFQPPRQLPSQRITADGNDRTTESTREENGSSTDTEDQCMHLLSTQTQQIQMNQPQNQGGVINSGPSDQNEAVTVDNVQ